MQAEDFVDAVSDADSWSLRSRSLRISADLIWDQFEADFSLYQKDAPATYSSLIVAFSYAQSAQLLYSLSMETALKSRIVRVSPELISLDVQMDGSGKMTAVKIKQLGGKIGSGHDLVRLAELAGLLKSGENVEGRAFLCFASECILRRSRYPIPLESSAPSELAHKLPERQRLFGFKNSAVQWIDEALRIDESCRV